MLKKTANPSTPCASEQQEHVSSVEEKLRSVRSSLQEVQLHCSQQKHTISELQAKNSQQSIEMDALRRRIEELQQVRVHHPPAPQTPLQERRSRVRAQLSALSCSCVSACDNPGDLFRIKLF